MSKLKPYSNYRPVKLNFAIKLPDGWKILRGKFVFKEMNERSVDGKEQLLSVSEHKGVVPRDSINVNMFQAENYTGYKLCNPGDVVINSLWAWHRGIGVAEHRGIVSTAYSVHRLRKPKEWNYKYLTYLLRTNAYVGEYLIRSKGIWDSRLQLTGSNFQDIQIIIPPLETQNAIVHYLDRKTQQIQEFIQKKERLIELLEEQKKSIIFCAVTKGLKNEDLTIDDFGIFGSIPKSWKKTKLKYVAYNLNNRRIPIESSDRGRMTERLYDYYGATGVIDKVDNYIYDETTLLVAEDGANLVFRNIQLVYKASGKYWVNNHAHIIKERNDINIDFLGFLLELTDYNPVITGSAQPKLTKEAFMSTLIMKPNKVEQDEIVYYILEKQKPLNNSISKAQTEIEKAKEYQESLITQIVTGQLKVPENTYTIIKNNKDLNMVAEPSNAYQS